MGNNSHWFRQWIKDHIVAIIVITAFMAFCITIRVTDADQRAYDRSVPWNNTRFIEAIIKVRNESQKEQEQE